MQDSSLSAELSGPQVLPGGQEARCQRRSPRAVPPSHRPPEPGCVWWENIGAAGAPGRSPESHRAMRGDAGPWVPRLQTLSGSGKGPGSGSGRREGRGAAGLGGAATDSLTSGNRNLFPGSPPTPPPNAPGPPGTAWHGSPSGWWGAPCKQPFPGSAPRHSTGEGEGCPWAALMAALCSPIHRGFLHRPVGARPGWQGARSPGTQRPLSPGIPGATFVWEPPGWREQGPAGQRLCPDTARIHGSSGTGGGVGMSPPPVWPTKRAFRAGSGRLPRTDLGHLRSRQDIAFPRQAGRSQRGACCQPDAPAMPLARSHAGLPLPRHAEGSRAHGAAEGTWACPGWSLPSSLPCAAPCVSHHAPVPAHPAARRKQGQPSVLALRRAATEERGDRSNARSVSIGFVSIAANSGQGRGSPGCPTQTPHNSRLPLSPLQLPASPSPAAPAQAAESGPASSQRHHPHLAAACCAGELERETSGPAERFPGRAARAPCAVASAPGPAPQPARGCSSSLIPALEIIYLLKNSFPWEVCSNAEGHLQLQGKNKQFEPWRP